LFAAAAVPFAALAQLPFAGVLETGASYDRTIPTPEQTLGFVHSTRFARSHEIWEYFQAVDRASDRVLLREHGRTWGGRRLFHAVISSPENLARIDAIRQENRRLVFDGKGLETGKMPLVLWMGYGVHGNEPSAAESSMLVLYHLAAARGKAADFLKEVVIVIVPNVNPDGRDRFVDEANADRGMVPTPDAEDREHTSRWPGGRTNHYWFDLNRDWLPLTQPESYLRHQVYTAWRPQVVLDYHEMGGGATYFFQPGVATRWHPLTPQAVKDWTNTFASFHAKALEKIGQNYFVGDRFDDFYAGKGSTYPDLTGSVGILFEQSSSRAMRLTVGDRVLEYPVTVRNQVATSLSSIDAAWTHRRALIEHMRTFHLAKAEPGAWKIKNDDRGREVVSLLMKHEVAVLFAKDAFWVPKSQPQSTLVRVMFEPLDTFEDDQFYDVSTWSLIHSSGAAISLEEALPAGLRPVQAGDLIVKGQFKSAPKPLGWVIRNDREDFHLAVWRTLARGRRAFFAREGVGPARPGDVFVEGSDGAEFFEGLTRELRVSIDGVPGETGQVVSWGSNVLVPLRRPRIVLAGGQGMDANNTGEVWWLLDAMMGIPVTVVDTDSGLADLRPGDVVVLAGGSPREAWAAGLEPFVRGGGTVVALSTSAEWLAGTELWKLPVAGHTPKLEGLPYGDLAEERGRHALPGSVFRVEWDKTHPLTFGVSSSFVFRDSGRFIGLPSGPGTIVARYSDPALASGYASDPVKNLGAGKLAVGATSLGSGRVILIADNPIFRGYFRAQERLFLNAVLFSRGF
jgi:hypothetical protein